MSACATDAPVGGPVARRGVREPADGLLGRVGDGPDDAREAAGGGERGALGVDGGGARAARQLAPLDGVVDDPAGVADDRRRAPGTRSGSSSQSTVPSASTTRRAVRSVPGSRPETSAPRQPERRRAGPRGAGRARPGRPALARAPALRGRALLDRERAGERRAARCLSAQRPCEAPARSPSRSRSSRSWRRARSRSGSRSARSGGRCRARSAPTRSRSTSASYVGKIPSVRR